MATYNSNQEIQFDDLSTLGGDDNEATITQVEQLDENHSVSNSVAAGDMDAEDIDADNRRYYEANQLVVEGFKCPDEFINVLTPMEFEEMVNLFVTFDANKSGTIDRHEAKKILSHLGIIR